MAGRKRFAPAFALVFAIACVFASPACAGDDIERIDSFASDITVQPDGGLAVRETIVVNAQGDDIVHGINRDFPTLGPGGAHVGFDVISVTRDGAPEAYDVRTIDAGKRVRIGDGDVELAHGLHTYVIAYTSDRQLRFFPRYDEVYWNVTGNGWQFEIKQAQAVVHLPPGAHIIQSAFYTGAAGAREHNARSEIVDSRTIRFVATGRYDAGQGLTVAIGFDKGVVTPARDGLTYFVRDHLAIVTVLAGTLLMLLYFAIAWLLVGRDPDAGPVIPLFAPPKDMSAAAVRYLRRMAYDPKMFAATLVSLGVKGVVTIAQDKDKIYTLTQTGAGADVDSVEEEVMECLFAEGAEIALRHRNYARIAGAVGAITDTLKKTYDDGYWAKNTIWFMPGAVILAATAVAMALNSDSPGEAGLTLLWGSLFGIAFAAFAWMDFTDWRNVLATRDQRAARLALAIFTLLPVLAFGGVAVALIFFTYDYISPIAIVLLLLPLGLAVLFQRLLRRPTLKAARLLAQIEGFKLFLTTAETGRLKMLNAPGVTPQLFEKFLPYAIALDCEDEWSKAFEAQAAAAGLSTEQTHSYEPMWFRARDFMDLGTSAVTAALGASLAASAAAASHSVSSGGGFSGSGGGGFSGGGGGGGGGSGW